MATGTVAARVKAVRLALKLTQEQLASRAGLNRVEIVAVETGKNQASTARMRDALARGFGLPEASLSQLLAGKLDVDAAVRIARGEGRPRVVSLPPDPRYPNRSRAIARLVEDGEEEADARRWMDAVGVRLDADEDPPIAWWYDRARWVRDLEREAGHGAAPGRPATDEDLGDGPPRRR